MSWVKKIKAGEVTVRRSSRSGSCTDRKRGIRSPQLCDDLTEEGALKRAEEVQKMIDAGELTGPLAGVPVAIKDNMCTEGRAHNLQF